MKKSNKSQKSASNVKVVNAIVAKAMSWNQVAKQLSGMSGKAAGLPMIAAFNKLGVKVTKNVIKSSDIFAAWSPLLKDTVAASKNGGVSACPMIAKNVAVMVDVLGADKPQRLYSLNEDASAYEVVRQYSLVRVTNAVDKQKGDVAVDVKAVLKGLLQSLEAEKEVAKVEQSAKNVEAIASGYVNVGTATAPEFVAVVKTANGVWDTLAHYEQLMAAAAKKKASKPAKRTNKKTVKPTRKSA